MVTVRLAPAAPGAAAVELPAEPGELRQAAGRLARELPSGTARLAVDGLTGARLTAFVEGLVLGSYRFGYRTGSADAGPAVIELCGADDDSSLAAGLRAAQATAWARDLANARR